MKRDLSQYAGRVTLVVNVASHDSFTDLNYKGESQPPAVRRVSSILTLDN